MRFGVASRHASGMTVNGDANIIKEWNGQTLLGIIDGLGHGEEASTASKKAKKFIIENHQREIDQIVQDLHLHLLKTRGVAAGLLKIDRARSRLLYCGIGNTEVRIIGEPPMHPASLNGILGMNMRKARKFEYQYRLLRAVVLHSDGVSSKFDLSDYPSAYPYPQEAAEQILTERGKEYDDATIVIAVENAGNVESRRNRNGSL